MWKILTVFCLCLPAVLPACGEQKEVTVKTIAPSPTTPTSAPTTTTAAPTTTTTFRQPPTTMSKASSYRGASQGAGEGVFDLLADCETGIHKRDANGNSYYVRGSAVWDENALHDGGLQFHPNTWTSYVAAGKTYALIGYPLHAYEASREQQIVVAIRVRDGVRGSSAPFLNSQGYGAWPYCRHYAGV